MPKTWSGNPDPRAGARPKSSGPNIGPRPATSVARKTSQAKKKAAPKRKVK